ncbi:hypothetical protein D3C81_843070 [compost metagenome]
MFAVVIIRVEGGAIAFRMHVAVLIDLQRNMIVAGPGHRRFINAGAVVHSEEGYLAGSVISLSALVSDPAA